jgi:hypothetical protein
MRVPSFGWGILAPVLLVAAFGCGGNKPIPVNGVVKLDGKPVEGAAVTFIPETGKTPNASGMSDKDGTFRLTTLKPNDGAYPGSYKVIVTYQEPYEAATPAGGMQSAFKGFEKTQKTGAKKPPKYVIPAKYGDPAKTDLKYTVPAEGNIEIDLKSR